MLAAKFFSSSNNEDQETPWLQNPLCKGENSSRRSSPIENWSKDSTVVGTLG